MAIAESTLKAELDRTEYIEGQNLKWLLFDRFRQIGIQNGIALDDEVFYMKSLADPQKLTTARSSAGKISSIIGKSISIPIAQGHALIEALVAEAVQSLRKSVLWFLNSRFNERYGWLSPSVQSRYYSEFSGLIGISRILGMALTFVPLFNVVQTKVDWVSRSIEVKLLGARRSGHQQHLELVKHSIDEFTFVSQDLRALLKAEQKLMLTDEREETVYAFEKASVVYSPWLRKPQSAKICFLGGENGLGVPEPADGVDISDYSEAMLAKYADYGYIEHTIGDLQRELTRLLKELCSPEVVSELHVLAAEVRQIPEVFDSERRDILAWLA